MRADLPAGGSAELRALIDSLGEDTLIRRPLELLSEDILPCHWGQIATACRELVADGAEQILILHGTDTMGYTAAALSFMLADLAVPVVLTGSNLSPNDPDTDAPTNVAGAIAALDQLGSGVFVAFAGERDGAVWVHRGTRVRKVSTHGMTYDSIGAMPLGWARPGVGQLAPAPDPTPVAGTADAASDDVLALRVHPGLRLDLLVPGIVQGGIRAVVVEIYASATANTASEPHSLAEFATALAAAGIPVFTTVAHAQPGSHEYPSLARIIDAGAVHLPGMLPEVAMAKAGWLLAQGLDGDGLRALMLRPVAGEI